MNWLNYHHLLYFKTIATEGGITNASRKLRIGQPALSAQLKQLENMLGTPLFDRKHRSLILTEAGKVALDYANEIFGLGEEMLNVFRDQSFSTRVRIDVGVLDGVPKICVTRLTQAALAAGECSVALSEGKSDQLFRSLFAHDLDLILTNHTPAFSKSERAIARPVAKFPVAVFGAPSFKPLARKFPASLHRQPFIVPSFDSKLRHDLDHFFSVNGIAIERVVESQDTAVQKNLCVEGTGLVAVPDVGGMEYVREKKLVRLGLLDGVTEEIWLVAGARRIENPIASKLMKSFKIEG
jgi:LysR family transcriptional activator of nhaA